MDKDSSGGVGNRGGIKAVATEIEAVVVHHKPKYGDPRP